MVEGLARSGVGALDLIDHDTVSLSNLNRQIIATMDTIGQYKVDVAAARVRSINPTCQVKAHRIFYLPETKDSFDFRDYDYVVDAIDTVAGKLALAEAARDAGVPILSAMGAGNKLDPSAFQVADLFQTSVCPLAKVMRRECRKRGIDHLKVVYSQEEPVKPKEPTAPVATDQTAKSDRESSRADGNESARAKGKRPPGSTAFAPSVMGLIIASEVVRDIGISS